ncbi:archease [Egibacter rhizosphaerae]|nr:archease [Egibacter rhizosphaerae]
MARVTGRDGASAWTEPYGSDLRLHVRGPDLASCADAVVRAVAEHVADRQAAGAAERRPFRLVGADPPALLVELVDEVIARLDVDGELACAVEAADGSAGAGARDVELAGTFVVVPLHGLSLRGAPPKAATWHGTALEPDRHGWRGQVLLDL